MTDATEHHAFIEASAHTLADGLTNLVTLDADDPQAAEHVSSAVAGFVGIMQSIAHALVESAHAMQRQAAVMEWQRGQHIEVMEAERREKNEKETNKRSFIGQAAKN